MPTVTHGATNFTAIAWHLDLKAAARITVCVDNLLVVLHNLLPTTVEVKVEQSAGCVCVCARARTTAFELSDQFDVGIWHAGSF